MATSSLGETVGLVVGLEVGDCVGLEVGEVVGLEVGLVVGDDVGDTVGLVLGATVQRLFPTPLFQPAKFDGHFLHADMLVAAAKKLAGH